LNESKGQIRAEDSTIADKFVVGCTVVVPKEYNDHNLAGV